MSREDVDVMRKGYEAFARGDLPAIFELLDPAVELHDPSSLPGAGTYYGHQGFVQLVQNQLEAWEEWRFEPEQFLDAGNEVVVLARLKTRGRGTGIALDELQGHVWTLRDGRVTRLRVYTDHTEALEAAGLQARSP